VDDIALNTRVKPVAISSPCVGVCTLDGDGYCIGCARTGAEIGAWLSLDESERQRMMDEVLPQREAERVRR
jgi:predicted Fe-S protein YdhL (DUF1289 family)